MAYTKIIQSGSLVEVFSYERHPPIASRRRKTKTRYGRRLSRNVSRARSSFIRLVSANLSSERRPAFATFTMREVVTLRQGWDAFARFSLRLRRSYHGRVSYIAVPEFQKRGAVHFHALIWGLTDDEISSERSSRTLAKLWGFGFVDLLPSDGSLKLAGYLSKYMVKSMYDPRLTGFKSYTASRGVARPVSFSSVASTSEILDELSTPVDNPLVPVSVREYSTQWLGRCSYQQFNF